MSEPTIKCVCGAESKDTHGWRVFADGRPSLCPACKWKTDRAPVCPDFKPSPQAAWMCAKWITEVRVPYGCCVGTMPLDKFTFCKDGLDCPTAGLRTKPRSNYSPGDDGEVE